ncbi:ATP synthase subunit I [Candidimonas nitroreducens]
MGVNGESAGESSGKKQGARPGRTEPLTGGPDRDARARAIAGSDTESRPGTSGHSESAGLHPAFGLEGKRSLPVAEAEAKSELTEVERTALVIGAGRGVVRTLLAQAIMGLLAVAVCWAVAGPAAGWSALIGAGAYFAPNALFAARLLLGLYGPGNASPLTFFLGEAFKLGATLVLLAVAAHWGRGWLVWPALLAGLVCVLKGYMLLFVWRRP